MESTPIHDAVKCLEKANADLEPELLSAVAARDLLGAYARVEKLASFGKAVLARKLDDATELARVTGTSVGKAKATVDTGKALRDADEVRSAFQSGDISLEQANEIAKAERAHPGTASELLSVATSEPFHVLRGAPPRRTVTGSPSRPISPTPTPRCCPGRARAGPGLQSSSWW
jgi:hypothetical protein